MSGLTRTSASKPAQAQVQASVCYESPDFPRQALWCPDGSSILTLSEQRHVDIHSQSSAADGDLPHLGQKMRLKCPSALVSACWYPGASASDPAMYAFLTACRDQPVNLLDGTTGKLRASYPIIDHTERFVGPTSMIFSHDGSRFFCGHDSAIEEMNLHRPGLEGRRYKTVPTRRSKDGQKGVISSLAMSTTTPDLLAAGSFAKSVGLYDSRSDMSAFQIFDSGSGSGVVDLQFHTQNPELFVANRQSDQIVCFDLRQAAQPSRVFTRPGRTNQRLLFNFDPRTCWLVSGDQDGVVHVWDTHSPEEGSMFQFKASEDSISSASFNPTEDLLAITSGSRHFPLSSDSSTSDSSLSDSDVSSSEDECTSFPWHQVSQGQRSSLATCKDGSLRLWKLS